MGGKICVPDINEEQFNNDAFHGASDRVVLSRPLPQPHTNDNVVGLDSVVIPTTIQRPMPVNRQSCPLLRYVWERDWPNVLKRVEKEAHEAHYVTKGSGRTALHLACFSQGGCPLYVAQKLLQANPHALWIQDSQKFTPLHCACAFRGNDDLIQLFASYYRRLVHVLRKSSKNNLPDMKLCQETPLYLACKRNSSVQVLSILLELVRDVPSIKFWVAPITGAERAMPPARASNIVDLQSFLRPLHELQVPPNGPLSSSKDPFLDLSQDLIESLRAVTPTTRTATLCAEQQPEQHKHDNDTTTTMTTNTKDDDDDMSDEQEYWRKVCLLCHHTAAAVNTKSCSNNNNNNNLLQTLVCIELTYTNVLQTVVCMELQRERLLKLACRVLPEQASTRMNNDGGFMILHYAICNRNLKCLDPIISIYPQAASIAVKYDTKMLLLLFGGERRQSLTIMSLLYPLHLLILNPRYTGRVQIRMLQSLIKAAPEIVRKQVWGFYPFQFAACKQREDKTTTTRCGSKASVCLGTIYVLLREAPELLEQRHYCEYEC